MTSHWSISVCSLTFVNHADSLKLSVVVLHLFLLSFPNTHPSADSGGFTLSLIFPVFIPQTFLAPSGPFSAT